MVRSQARAVASQLRHGLGHSGSRTTGIYAPITRPKTSMSNRRTSTIQVQHVCLMFSQSTVTITAAIAMARDRNAPTVQAPLPKSVAMVSIAADVLASWRCRADRMPSTCAWKTSSNASAANATANVMSHTPHDRHALRFDAEPRIATAGAALAPTPIVVSVGLVK